jgi:hypothetical protein
MIAAAMKISEEVRRAGAMPLALALNRDMEMKAERIEEMRELERRLIIGRCVDEVLFYDPESVELDDLVRLARQYGLYAPRADVA